LLPSFDSGEDPFGISGPDEGFWIGVRFCDEAVDGRFEIIDGAEHATLEASSGELGEEAFNGIEPRRRGRREVECPARMLHQPFADFGMFVSGIVIDDGMDRLAFGDLSVDEVEEADELLVSMALHVAADDSAVEDVEGGEQGRGAVALVIMCHRAGAAGLERQARLGAVECLDLALFVDREDHRMSGRVDVEADNVLEFLCELGIVRQLERSDAMGGELMGLTRSSDARTGGGADALPPRLPRRKAVCCGTLRELIRCLASSADRLLKLLSDSDLRNLQPHLQSNFVTRQFSTRRMPSSTEPISPKTH